MFVGTFAIVSGHYLADVKTTTQSLWISVFGVIFSIIPMTIIEHPTLPRTLETWVYLCLHSITVSLLNMVSIVSISLIGPLVVSVLLPLYLVLMYVLQITWLSSLHPGHQNLEEIIGIVLVLSVSMVTPLCDFYFKQNGGENDEDKDEDMHLLIK